MAQSAAARNLFSRVLRRAGRQFRDRVRSSGVNAVTLVPLTAGDNRLGAFGFGCLAPYDPSPAELAFLERVASEFAVAVESFLARQEAVRERDRLRTLFDITNALVSKLSTDELFSAISAQLSNVIRARFLRDDVTRRDRQPGDGRSSFHRHPAF